MSTKDFNAYYGNETEDDVTEFATNHSQSTTKSDVISAILGGEYYINGNIIVYGKGYKEGTNVELLRSAQQGDPFGLAEKSPNSAYTVRENTVGIADLFFEFITGTGPEYSMFTEGHPMVKQLKESYLVTLAKGKFVLEGSKPLRRWDAPFGVVDAAMSDNNLTAQFVGGARISIIPTAAGNLFIVDNTTGRYSFEAHLKPDVPRDPNILTPEGNVYQRFIWLEK